jgi:nickel-dependent lactate racemase
MSNHGATNIASPRAAFGHTRGNPIWEEMRDIALRVGPSFLLNVTLDPHRRITGVFAGDLLGATCRGLRASAPLGHAGGGGAFRHRRDDQ